MSVTVVFTEDPRFVLARAGDFLAADPVRNSVLLTVLHERVASPQAGRYWVAESDGSIRGVAFQTPLTFPLLASAMSDETAHALVDRILQDGLQLPGAGSDARTAAAIAGQWAERTKSPARPDSAGRQYECEAVVPPPNMASGQMRPGTPADRDLLVKWGEEFTRDAGALSIDNEAFTDAAIANGLMWVWDDGGPVSLSVQTLPTAGVVRIQRVYTPLATRGRGYASACVAALTSQILADGHRCTLFTDLANPTANSVYQRIGYRAVQEIVRYQFGE